MKLNKTNRDAQAQGRFGIAARPTHGPLCLCADFITKKVLFPLPSPLSPFDFAVDHSRLGPLDRLVDYGTVRAPFGEELAQRVKILERDLAAARAEAEIWRRAAVEATKPRERLSAAFEDLPDEAGWLSLPPPGKPFPGRALRTFSGPYPMNTGPHAMPWLKG